MKYTEQLNTMLGNLQDAAKSIPGAVDEIRAARNPRLATVIVLALHAATGAILAHIKDECCEPDAPTPKPTLAYERHQTGPGPGAN